MQIKNVNSDNVILQNKLISQMHVRNILKEKNSEALVEVYSKKHGTSRFGITREEALALLEPKISDLEKKVEAL